MNLLSFAHCVSEMVHILSLPFSQSVARPLSLHNASVLFLLFDLHKTVVLDYTAGRCVILAWNSFRQKFSQLIRCFVSFNCSLKKKHFWIIHRISCLLPLRLCGFRSVFTNKVLVSQFKSHKSRLELIEKRIKIYFSSECLKWDKVSNFQTIVITIIK